MDVARVLRLVGPFLEDRGEPWALVGGLALLAWGAPRATFDADILAPRDVQGDLVGRAVRVLREAQAAVSTRPFDLGLGEEDLRAMREARLRPHAIDREAALRLMASASPAVDAAVRRRSPLTGPPFKLPGHEERHALDAARPER